MTSNASIRPAHRRSHAGLAGVLALTLLAACGSSDKIDEAALKARIDVIETEVTTRTGLATCVQDSDCRSLPMGALACGGPSRFHPYSKLLTDEAAMAKLGEDHRRLSAELLTLQATAGPCVALATPTPFCSLSAPLTCKLR
jgi:hypothetical protein